MASGDVVGQVTRRSLPVYDGPPPPEAPPLKRVRLGQGDIVQFHQGEVGMRYIAWVELKADGIRGNHYHLLKLEHLCLLAGEADLGLEDLETGERSVVRLKVGDLVVIPPRVAHAVRTVVPGHAVEFAPEPLADGDTYPHEVIPRV
jgi:mannose-6-phosphate isomerase-like protein (cupin superfamily)